MDTVVVTWKRYRNFFELWAAHGSEPTLVYVIGETHHCYVGSVGAKGGRRGLRRRYEKQYLDRARAIFGREAPEAQPAFAGFFEAGPEADGRRILAVEGHVQRAFVARYGDAEALFKRALAIEGIAVTHRGDVPLFLRDEAKDV